MRKKPKHHVVQFTAGFILLIIGLALVVANLSLPSEKLDLLEGIFLMILGGYLVTSLVWES